MRYHSQDFLFSLRFSVEKTIFIALVGFLGSACLAKPSMHVRKLGSSSRFSDIAPNSMKAENVPTAYYVDGRIVEEKAQTSEGSPEARFRTAFKTSQAYQFSISVADEQDLEREWTLNVVTILKHKSNSGGYGYTKTASFKLKFHRTGANEGALRMIYLTPQRFGAPTDPEPQWIINGIATELLDGNGKVMRSWSNASFGMKFAEGLASFFRNRPRTMHSAPIQSGSFGLVALANENVAIEGIVGKD